MFDKAPAETQARHESLRRIEEKRSSAERFVLIHGDCGSGHGFFDGVHMTGIIDWGCATIGDPCYDIAQVICVAPEWATTEIDDDVRAFFEGYGTPPVPIEIIRYYQDLYDLGGGGCVQAMHGEV